MSNDARRVIYNTRERAESDDLNNTTDLLLRQAINNLAFTNAPDAFTGLNLYGVVAGLVVLGLLGRLPDADQDPVRWF